MIPPTVLEVLGWDVTWRDGPFFDSIATLLAKDHFPRRTTGILGFERVLVKKGHVWCLIGDEEIIEG